MNVHINLLRLTDSFRVSLRQDGWVVLAANDKGALDATHPDVKDENAARIRLDRLGMLTSAAIRIEFRPEARALTPR